MIIITETAINKKKLFTFWQERQNLISKITGTLKELDDLTVELLKEKKKVIVTNSDGNIIATIDDGLWVEEKINLSMAVYNCVIEQGTKDEERYNFPASLKLISEGKGNLLKKQIEEGYKRSKKAYEKYMEGYYKSEQETGKDYTSSLATRLD